MSRALPRNFFPVPHPHADLKWSKKKCFPRWCDDWSLFNHLRDLTRWFLREPKIEILIYQKQKKKKKNLQRQEEKRSILNKVQGKKSHRSCLTNGPFFVLVVTFFRQSFYQLQSSDCLCLESEISPDFKIFA